MFTAGLILLWQPESLMSASFQLSFAATLGLIAFYEWLARRWRIEGGGGRGIVWRIRFYFLGLLWSPLVAGAFTAPLIMHEFQQCSTYTLLSNMLADPLVDFIMMPLVMLGLLLMPLHLEAVAFAPLQWSVTLMLRLADTISTLPHAQLHTPRLTEWGLALVVFGGLWLAIWEGKKRWWGITAIAVGMASVWCFTVPDILVSDDGKEVAANLGGGRWELVRGREKSFIAQQWKQYLMIDHFEDEPRAGDPLACDDAGCVYRKNGRSIVVTGELLQQECANLSPLPLAGGGRGRVSGHPHLDPPPQAGEEVLKFPLTEGKVCLAQLVKRNEGAVAITPAPDGMRVETAKQMQGKRPWVP